MINKTNQPKKRLNLKYTDTLSVTQNDIQYQLWSNLIKKASDNLVEKQLRLMSDSSKLIDFYNQQLANTKNNDPNTTRDQTQGLLTAYLGFDKQKQQKSNRESIFKINLSNDNMMLFSRNQNGHREFNSPNERLIYRKSPLSHHQSFNLVFSRQLKDIEENCRPKTLKSMKMLIDDLRKLKKYFTQYQSNQKRLIRNLQALEKDRQEYLILKRVNQQNSKKLQQITKQLEQNKIKMKHFISEKNSMLEVQPKDYNCFKDVNIVHLTSYLQKKQKIINNKLTRIIELQDNTLKMIQNTFSQQMTVQGCQNCCSFMKKAKESLKKLRGLLMEQSQEMQKLYADYRRLLIQDTARISQKYIKGAKSIKSLSIRSENTKSNPFLKFNVKNPQNLVV